MTTAIPNLGADTSEKTMKFLATIIKMKKKEKMENRFCFFDYQRMREKEEFKAQLRDAMMSKLRQYADRINI
jgi:hypothetical protein